MDCDVVGPHVNSFDFLVDDGLAAVPETIPPQKFKLNEMCVEMSLTSLKVAPPAGDKSSRAKLYPNECRQRGSTYAGKMTGSVRMVVDGRVIDESTVFVGEVPIMLQSKVCTLRGLSMKQLYSVGEEPHEMGGYYVVNGSEKVIRTLVVMRRNYPVGLVRDRFESRGKMFTKYAMVMRCVVKDCRATTITLHYLENACMQMSFRFGREAFFVPLMYILKGMSHCSDKYIYNALIRGREKDNFWKTCVMNMLTSCLNDGVYTGRDALRRLGKCFRGSAQEFVAPWDTDEQVGAYILKHSVLPHIEDGIEKLYTGVYMAQKLMALVKNEIPAESPDSVQFQEAAMSGHIVLSFVRSRLDQFMLKLRNKLEMECRINKQGFTLDDLRSHFAKTLGRPQLATEVVTRALLSFLATGNLPAGVDIGAGQKSGFSVIAERINFLRFASHFRAIHRGSSFQEMRTTEVRKLKTEAWGFICPVHTPDGAPCGLLNHLTASCKIVSHKLDTSHLVEWLNNHGVLSHDSLGLQCPGPLPKDAYPVLLDGRFLGFILGESDAQRFCLQLREAKVDASNSQVSSLIEIAFVPMSPNVQHIQMQMPGVFIFSETSRLMRPVTFVDKQVTEYIGTFEQIYLSVCIDPSEAEKGVTRHQEISPISLFSYMGNLIPFPDHNQSPRNVYQCQMAKQTMGIPCYAWRTRADNKMYRILTPQKPIVRTECYDKYNIDDYPLGTNAIVAVISYTGYDMEDAMSINKAAWERGLAYGHVIKVERVDLTDKGKAREKKVLQLDPTKTECLGSIGWEGLPVVGKMYREGMPYLCKRNLEEDSYSIEKFKGSEEAYCEHVRVVRNDASPTNLTHALITWRICRNPTIGDKFASRHGQKGICSFLWPTENMPFTESGMVPDILFNPHGYPSRMTIGMMIESMAGKSAAMHGWAQDCTPFVFSEEKPAIDFYGKQLEAAGYNYYGNEVMYSGTDGREFTAHIFMGIVYYQRLRHMVADKFQVRATGPIESTTMQPVKGRKRQGGVRFGEMERDALIAHGVAACIQDRLFYASDHDVAHVCNKCGSILSVADLSPAQLVRMDRLKPRENGTTSTGRRPFCLVCGSFKEVNMISVPHVFRYLAAELASVGIRLVLKTTLSRGMRKSLKS